MNKALVCYQFTKYDDISQLNRFIKNYQKYPAGTNHELLICFKLINEKKFIKLRKLLKHIKYTEYIDPSEVNDYDFGSYKRVAQKYSNRPIMFLSSHSYPVVNFWLKKLIKNFKTNMLIGTTASYESILSSLNIKKFYKLFSFLNKKLQYSKKFNSFPNPHVRTTGFLIKGKDFTSFIKNKKFSNKEDCWMAESGKNNLTSFFKNKNFKILIINSDGEKFTEKNWEKSKTYCSASVSKSIISDKHTRKYHLFTNKKKQIIRANVWGKIL